MIFVVLGGSGLVGSHVMEAGAAAGHRMVGTTRAAGSATLRQLELADGDATIRLLEQEAADVVVYAAGWTWVDGCEGDSARSRRENFEQPLAVARWCARRGARFVYYSTSYVFDGADGDYVETDSVSPRNVYGRHKADAEVAVLDSTSGEALVPRLICVWGRESARKNFAYQVRKAVENKAAMTLPCDQRGNPTWAGDIATWSIRLSEQARSGIWHLAGRHPDMTRPEWARRILRGLATSGRAAELRIEERTTDELRPPAPRPLRAGMNTAKAQSFHPLACREPDDLPADL